MNVSEDLRKHLASLPRSTPWTIKQLSQGYLVYSGETSIACNNLNDMMDLVFLLLNPPKKEELEKEEYLDQTDARYRDYIKTQLKESLDGLEASKPTVNSIPPDILEPKHPGPIYDPFDL